MLLSKEQSYFKESGLSNVRKNKMNSAAHIKQRLNTPTRKLAMIKRHTKSYFR